jgi:hypothetical protein
MDAVSWSAALDRISAGDPGRAGLPHVDWTRQMPATAMPGRRVAPPESVSALLRWTAGFVRYRNLGGWERFGVRRWPDELLGPVPSPGGIRSTGVVLTGAIDGTQGVWEYDPLSHDVRLTTRNSTGRPELRGALAVRPHLLDFKYGPLADRLAFIEAGCMLTQLALVARLDGFSGAISVTPAFLVPDLGASTWASLDLSQRAPLPASSGTVASAPPAGTWGNAVWSRRTARGRLENADAVRPDLIVREGERLVGVTGQQPVSTVIASQDDPLRNELVGLLRGNTAFSIVFFGDYRSAFEQGDPDWYEHETMRVGASLHGCALAAARAGVDARISCEFSVRGVTAVADLADDLVPVAALEVGRERSRGGWEHALSRPPMHWR